MEIKAFASYEVGGELKPFNYKINELGKKEVIVKISHCGICHSDLHLIDNDWKYTKYPIVPGHEVVGFVEKLGDDVKHLKIGDRVGIGWLSGSCHECEWCSKSEEPLCPDRVATCAGHHGGFAEYIVTDSLFAFPIPEQLASENAAPLMCGGITVYSPLRDYGVNHLHKVGVIGIGGLGHLAIQFAAKMGCEVTAFSTSKDKENEAKELGAVNFINSNNPEEMAKAINSLDFIISTVTVDLNWIDYINILRPHGKLCFVGASPGNLDIPIKSFMFKMKSITGSIIGGRTTMSEMLEFAARHRIQAKTELFSFDDINNAIERLRNNQARYRIVLKNNI